MQLRAGNSRLLWQLLVLLVLGACHAQFEEVHENNEEEAWKAGVFTPQPLRPISWLLPTPPPQTEPRVDVPGVGQVQGRVHKVIKNRPVNAFLGVRFAQINGGLGRFQPARAVPFQTFINATQSSPNCAQFPEVDRLRAAEARGENVDDCLTLDIYSPAGARNLPVLVFVHGEMLFDGGSEEAQPDYVLEHDVVLVSINYRLAPFGFLTALTDELPGNVALSDLQLALEWVQRNIVHFGGDNRKTTLIGQAGGATLAHALSISPKTQHLFQQLILQSGTALNPYLIDEKPLETLTTFAQLARCPRPGRNLGPLYECLRRLRTSQLVAIFEQLLQQNEPRGLTALGGFKLVVGDRLGYLPEHPAALVASSSVRNQTKPTIVGAAKDASAFILSRFYNQIHDLRSQNVSDYINVILRHTAPPEQHKIWHDLAIREIFTPETLRHVNAESVSQGLLELSNLILYRAPAMYSIRLSHQKSPTYLYTFDYRGQHLRFGHLDNPLPFRVDASLSDDSVYLFPYPVETSNLNTQDMSVARALVAMWVSFAQTGIPNANSNVWPRAAAEYGPFLRFTNSRESILEVDQHFGDGIYVPNLYAKFFNTTASTTTTTTTTTRRPYPSYTNQPYRPPQQPDSRPVYTDYYNREEELRRQNQLREQQERELKLREQQAREQQQQQDLQREEEERIREQQQRDAQLQREQQLREQAEREERQRAEQQREHEARLRQEQYEQNEREQQQREYEARQQKEREQQLYEQRLREEQERAQQPHVMPEPTEHQQEHEQQSSQEEREQESREQREREQQQREQVAREEHDRAQHQSYPSPVDTPPEPTSYPSYEEYLKAYEQWAADQNSRYNPERYASAEQEAPAESAPTNDPYAAPMYAQYGNHPQRVKSVRRPQRQRFL